MFPAAAAMSNSTSLSEETSISSGTRVQDFNSLNPPIVSTLSPPPPPQQQQEQQKIKKKRSLPGNPDPDAEVIALSPKALLATNRFVCEICNKGFPRDQNLQLHRRGHNLPWKLKQRNSKDVKKRAYVCPEPSCVHHHPSRALGDLTGIKKHYCRKHGEKKWKCEKCSKIYAVQSDWKAHSKTCGTREYRCDCGTLFSRKDSFITHRAFCDALAEESARLQAHQLVSSNSTITTSSHSSLLLQTHNSSLFPLSSWDPLSHQNPNNTTTNNNPLHSIKPENFHLPPPPLLFQEPPPALPVPPATTHKHGATTTFITTTSLPFQNHLSSAALSAPQHHLSATALLQKAATVGSTHSMGHTHMSHLDMGELGSVSQVVNGSSNFLGELATWQKRDRLTRDFLGLTGDDHHHHHGCNGIGATNNTGSGGGSGVNVSMNVREMLTYTGGVGFQQQPYERDQSLVKPHGVGLGRHHAASETWGDC